jgi:hypothetical protein
MIPAKSQSLCAAKRARPPDGSFLSAALRYAEVYSGTAHVNISDEYPRSGVVAYNRFEFVGSIVVLEALNDDGTRRLSAVTLPQR